MKKCKTFKKKVRHQMYCWCRTTGLPGGPDLVSILPCNVLGEKMNQNLIVFGVSFVLKNLSEML